LAAASGAQNSGFIAKWRFNYGEVLCGTAEGAAAGFFTDGICKQICAGASATAQDQDAKVQK
jgi:hypothetical protein